MILAFDTRERLIQWQVKIANNLGEGIKILTFNRNKNKFNKILHVKNLFIIYETNDSSVSTSALQISSLKC